MPVWSGANLAKSYGGQTVFTGVSLVIETGDRVALVGANGSGKTTLIRMMAGKLEPDGGHISRAKGVQVGYLSQQPSFPAGQTVRDAMMAAFQHVHDMERDLNALAETLSDGTEEERADRLVRYTELYDRLEHAGGYDYEHTIDRVLLGLGLPRRLWPSPVEHLSGGQRTRAALARLLLSQPDLLLLDEPTNHLDLGALEWLENYLGAWDGTLVVVAHDPYFLDRVTRRTLEMERGRLETYSGGFSAYVRLRAERMARRQKDYEQQQEFIARTEEFIRRNLAGQRTKEAQGRRTRLERLERVEAPIEAKPQVRARMTQEAQSGRTVLELRDLVLGYAAKPAADPMALGGLGLANPAKAVAAAPPARSDDDDDDGLEPAQIQRTEKGEVILLRVPRQRIERGQRVALLGPNGSGKSTLLKTLMGEVPALGGIFLMGHNVRPAYYAQEHEDLDPKQTVLDVIVDLDNVDSLEQGRRLLARYLFTGESVWKNVGDLSGGERSRLALARLERTGANFLLLDEPTNHLDLSAREVFAQALAGFPGTLLVVSHDRWLIDAVADVVWAIEDGGLAAYDGNYTSYKTQLAARAQAEKVAARPAPAAPSERSNGGTTGGRPAAKSGATVGSKRQVGELEASIASQEAVLRQLEAALHKASESGDVAKVSSLGQDYVAERARLEALYGTWERAAADVES